MSVAAALAAALPGRVSTDPALCALRSEDIAGPAAHTVAAVVRPQTAAEVAQAVATARAAGAAVLPRGGGMSYTGGYLPPGPGAVSLDLTGLDAVREIDAGGRAVLVEAGCTWARLAEALAAHGLRTPFFGPLSGIAATVGGSLSQNGAFFGSTAHGYAADMVLGLEVVDGTGALHRIGAWGAGRAAALPRFGPDLIGPFLGDCGVLGVKTAAWLRVIPLPPVPAFASFAFEGAGALARALLAARDIPHIAELWAFDAEAHRGLARTGFTVLETAGMAAEMAGRAGSLFGAAKALARAATLRRAVLAELPWSLHAVIEPPLAGLAAPVAGALAAACTQAGGRAIPDTIPRVTRARPFRAIRALVGPDGERWLPCHAVFPADRLEAVLDAVAAHLAGRAREVRVSTLVSLIGGEALVEPQLLWPDALSGFQRAHARPEQVAAHGKAPARPGARAAALALRGELVALMADLGGAHLQVGRTYRYAPDLSPGMAAMLGALKRTLDPDGILNPGVLGLG